MKAENFAGLHKIFLCKHIFCKRSRWFSYRFTYQKTCSQWIFTRHFNISKEISLPGKCCFKLQNIFFSIFFLQWLYHTFLGALCHITAWIFSLGAVIAWCFRLGSSNCLLTDKAMNFTARKNTFSHFSWKTLQWLVLCFRLWSHFWRRYIHWVCFLLICWV